jgi:hypothetical protein
MCGCGRSAKPFVEQRLAIQTEVFPDVGQNGRNRPHLQRVVAWGRDMVFAVALGSTVALGAGLRRRSVLVFSARGAKCGRLLP